MRRLATIRTTTVVWFALAWATLIVALPHLIVATVYALSGLRQWLGGQSVPVVENVTVQRGSVQAQALVLLLPPLLLLGMRALARHATDGRAP